jgi:hypothetical protein
VKGKRSKPGSVPCCAACGRKLRKARYVLIDAGLSYVSIESTTCGDLEKLTSDGMEPFRGDYGDNLVCGQRCGHALAVRIVRSIPGVLALLPEAWRR